MANLKKTEDVIRELSKVYENSFYDKIREVFNIKDGNTLAAVINHTGQMLNDITIGKQSNAKSIASLNNFFSINCYGLG